MTLSQLKALEKEVKAYASLAQQIQNGCVQDRNCKYPKEFISREKLDAEWRKDYVAACAKYRKIDANATRRAADDIIKRQAENFEKLRRGQMSEEENRRQFEIDSPLLTALEQKYSSELKQCAGESAKEIDTFEAYRDSFFRSLNSLYYDMLELQTKITDEISRKTPAPTVSSRPAVRSTRPAPSITLAPRAQPANGGISLGKAVRFASCSRFEQHVAGKVLGTGGCDIVFENGARRSMWLFWTNAQRGKIVDETFYIKRSGGILQDCELTLWESGGFRELCKNL